jgi:hypothetical protein
MQVSGRQSARKKTVSDVLLQVGDRARERLHPCFTAAGVSYPPRSVTLLAVKTSAQLEVWVNEAQVKSLIRTYPIMALSGGPGPKLAEGDRQVPEGVYRIAALNPNSRFHLSMKLNYPNAFDLEQAAREGREFPGTDIFIHGRAQSVGCLAMGDTAIEELFVLVADTGYQQVDVVIAPDDPRCSGLQSIEALPWTDELYRTIESAFARYKK